MHKLQQQKPLVDELTPLLVYPKFLSYIDRTGDCWLWTGFVHPETGYGRCYKKYGSRSPHRAAFIMAHGPILDGNYICHLCDNKRCVRPNHLVQGSVQQNHDDMWAKGRGISGSDHVHSKLSPEQVASLKEDRLNGATFRELGEKYNVSRQTANNVVRGKRYALNVSN